VSPARGVAEGGVPDRATLKTTSGAMVAVLRFFSRALHVVPLAYPAAPSRLELFKLLGGTCLPWNLLLESKASAFGFLEEIMNFDEVIQLQVLKLKALSHGANMGRLVDMAIEQGQLTELRQLCAKVHPSLIDRLDQVANLLDMSKREFIEAAVSDALVRAEEAISRSGALDQGGL